MKCLHCTRKIEPASLLGNGCRHRHTDTTFRLCNPTDWASPWATPAPEPKESA